MENKDLIHKKSIKYMEMALKEAKKAYDEKEVPIGCIIIDENDNILAKTHNKVENKRIAISHAEILAIEKASKKKKEKYLKGCKIFITLEPCPMCATAISLSKIDEIYIGCEDEKGGGILNGSKIYETSKNLYKPKIYKGILEKEAKELIQKFFKELRNKKQLKK